MKDFDKHDWVKKLNDTQNELLIVSNEWKDAAEKLGLYYKELEALQKKYDYDNHSKKTSELARTKTTLEREIRYFMFRVIVDSIYDILKEYGWKYSDKVLDWANRNFHINFYLDEIGFEEFWVDYVSDGDRIWSTYNIKEKTTCFEDYDFGRIKFPSDINLQSFVSSLDVYMSHLKHEEEANKEVEEYNEYQRLKKKFGGD